MRSIFECTECAVDSAALPTKAFLPSLLLPQLLFHPHLQYYYHYHNYHFTYKPPTSCIIMDLNESDREVIINCLTRHVVLQYLVINEIVREEIMELVEQYLN